MYMPPWRLLLATAAATAATAAAATAAHAAATAAAAKGDLGKVFTFSHAFPYLLTLASFCKCLLIDQTSELRSD